MVGFEMVGQQPATVEKDLDTLSLVNNVPLVSASEYCKIIGEAFH